MTCATWNLILSSFLIIGTWWISLHNSLTLSWRSHLPPKIFPEPGKYPLISSPPLMIKHLQRSSSELRLLLELNDPRIRDDPWNAAPHILAAVERADDVYLCLKRLSEYNQPPLVKVAHYIDFFRQILEVFYSPFSVRAIFYWVAKGLSSLHERCIAGLSCAEASSYMVDLSSASPTSAISSHNANIGPQQFDRVSYPVKYYLVNYTNASYIHKKPISSSSTPGWLTRELESLDSCPFKKDVQDSATMIDGLLSDVILQKFFPLLCIQLIQSVLTRFPKSLWSSSLWSRQWRLVGSLQTILAACSRHFVVRSKRQYSKPLPSQSALVNSWSVHIPLRIAFQACTRTFTLERWRRSGHASRQGAEWTVAMVHLNIHDHPFNFKRDLLSQQMKIHSEIFLLTRLKMI